MRTVFADTGYWIALLYPDDALHEVAEQLQQSLDSRNTRIITSDLVLVEFVNFFSKKDPAARRQVINFVTRIQQNTNALVVSFTTDLFDRALTLYAQRLDKQWSLTDCSSFILMQDLNITEAVAHDKHFEQAGFRRLMQPEDR